MRLLNLRCSSEQYKSDSAKPFAQEFHFAAQFIQALQEFGLPEFVASAHATLNVKRPIRFENTERDLPKCFESLAMQDCQQLFIAEKFLFQCVFVKATVGDQGALHAAITRFRRGDEYNTRLPKTRSRMISAK